MRTVSLRQAWIALIGGALLLGLVPGGIALDRRLATELESKAREDLAMTPMILEDRNAGRAEALSMRAREVAGTDGLATAVESGRRTEALRVAGSALERGERAVVIGPDGRAWTGTSPPPSAVSRARSGEPLVAFGHDAEGAYRLALAPLLARGRWTGAAGVLTRIDSAAVGELAALTRSDVVLLGPDGGVLTTTLEGPLPSRLADSAASWSRSDEVRSLRDPGGERYWAVAAPLGAAGQAVFLRRVSEQLALLPGLRRSALLSLGIALALALLVGGALASRMTRPVQALAVASQRLSAGDFEARIPPSRIRELDDVRRAFARMRSRLKDKIEELTAANAELEDRQARLQALQAELIQRDRLAATGRVITELAHEIRNPVASVRNCLELIDRRLDETSELREFSAMAIDELVRMHRLAEQMLDANRPLDPDASTCRPVEIAREVAELTRLARRAGSPAVTVQGPEDLEVAMGPDGLKQVLLNLLENAREAMAERPGDGDGRVDIRVAGPGASTPSGPARIEVMDTGPGLDESVRPRIFDPFFTTKEEVRGVGLGLFVAEGLVRRHGGSIEASNRREGGACFLIRLPLAASDGGARAAATGGPA